MRTPSTRRKMLTLAICCLIHSGVTFAQGPTVRASLPEKDEVWVGQSVILVVELLAPGFFASAASFDVPDPPGILIVPPSGSPVVGSETIGGTSYTVQRHELSVLARHPGDLAIPTFTVRFRYKPDPLAKESIAAAVKTPPLRFVAKTPPGAESLGSVLSARKLSAVEKWTPEPGRAKAGDAFTRVITFSAEGIPAIAFPAVPVHPVEGLGVYPKPPEVTEHRERGQQQSERRESVTYVCQRGGEYEIPEMRFSWFDLDTKQLRSVVFPGRTLQVVANSALADLVPATPPSRFPDHVTILLAIIVALGLGALAARRQTRTCLRRLIAPMRPSHLQPLNPVQLPSHHS